MEERKVTGFFNSILSNQQNFILMAEIVLVAIILIAFIFFQSRSNKKARTEMKRDITITQEELFSNAAEILAKKLADYSETVLVDKINGYYSTLVSKELLPNVNDAAKRIAELSETVVKRQETGMKELAVMLADLLASKTNDYIKQEAEVIKSLQTTTAVFSNELSRITGTVNELSTLYSKANEQSTAISQSVSEAANVLSDKILALSTVMDSTANSVAQMQTYINENSELAKGLAETTAEAQRLASEANTRLAGQNEMTAQLLNDAVNKMGLNTENAAKAVLAEFSTNLNATTESISSTVTTLKDIAESINSSATNFSAGIDNIYKDFGSDLDKNLNSVTSNISASISAEYQKIVTSAQSYSNTFTDSVSNLNTSLEQQIGGLKTITDQLNHNVLSFKNDVDMSSSKFEVGMERSISAALDQMDSSLAEIVKRLVTVTVNIQEAADALPKAVKAVKDIN